MNTPKLLTLIVALVAVIVIGVAGYAILRPPVALLSGAGIDATEISPNADGAGDITTIRYSLARPGTGQRVFSTGQMASGFYFRKDQRRSSGEYAVLFSGIVDGYRLPARNSLARSSAA